MQEPESLGIIVNSNRYFGFVARMAEAALAKRRPVRIHLIGPGCAFLKTPDCVRLSASATITLCDLSVRQLALDDLGPIQGRVSRVPPEELSMILEHCGRYVVF